MSTSEISEPSRCVRVIQAVRAHAIRRKEGRVSEELTARLNGQLHDQEDILAQLY